MEQLNKIRAQMVEIIISDTLLCNFFLTYFLL